MSDRLRDVATGGGEPKKKGLAAWFAGRGRRREYWLFVAPAFVLMMIGGGLGMVVLTWLAGLPVLFAYIRRLHDLGHSGWWAPVINVVCNVLAALGGAAGDVGALVGSLPYLIVMIALGAIPGERETNEYGPPPGKPNLAETFS